jgi:hypothetical protein
LVERLRALQQEGKPVDIRGGNKVASIDQMDDHASLDRRHTGWCLPDRGRLADRL